MVPYYCSVYSLPPSLGTRQIWTRFFMPLSTIQISSSASKSYSSPSGDLLEFLFCEWLLRLQMFRKEFEGLPLGEI